MRTVRALAPQLKSPSRLGFNPAVRLSAAGERRAGSRGRRGRACQQAPCKRDLLGRPALPFHKVLDATLHAIRSREMTLLAHGQECYCWLYSRVVEERLCRAAYLPYPPFDDRLGGEHPLPDSRQLHVYSSATYR